MSTPSNSGLRTGGSRATDLIPIPANLEGFQSRIDIRLLSIEEFINSKGSGTLRKNKAIGMNVTSHALHERVAYEFGYQFEICPERFLTWGEARSEGDCKPLTEVGWFAERYASVCLFPGDEIEVKYLTAEVDGVKREGVGIIVRTTSAPWIPKGYVVFAIIAEYVEGKGYLEARNPC